MKPSSKARDLKSLKQQSKKIKEKIKLLEKDLIIQLKKEGKSK